MYKFSSLWLELGTEVNIVERASYNLLEFLGDIGGLMDALYILGMVALFPFTNFTRKVELLTKLFRVLPAYSDPHDEGDDGPTKSFKDF